jgi:hypothetical protein
MRLSDLDPKLVGTVEKGVLRFDCPLGTACPLGGGGVHAIRVHIHSAPFAEVDGEKHWQASGIYPDGLTLVPSINEYALELDGEGKPVQPERIAIQGWHGFITNGDAR